jgi:hypothetical protein
MELRQSGLSIGAIERELGIPRSTLSGWFKSIKLTAEQEQELERRWKEGLVNARQKATVWHTTKKQERIEAANESGRRVLEEIDTQDPRIMELALAFLYLGEGAKGDTTSLGSSDPTIARFFVESLKRLYGIPSEKIRCYLHLRADQNPELLRSYWAKQLMLPEASFGKTSVDMRTRGNPTYPHYKGVCAISCGKVEIRRRLMYIAESFCEGIAPDTSRT